MAQNAIRKGINIWSFDQSLSIEECMAMAKDADFEGIELALSARGPLSMESSDGDILKIRDTAAHIGIEISALAPDCTGSILLPAIERIFEKKPRQWLAVR